MRWRRRAVLGALGGVGLSLTNASSSTPDRPLWLPSRHDREPRLRDAVSQHLTRDGSTGGYPSAAMFAAVDRSLIAHFAVGDATPSTMYDLASLTKVFTAVLALRLVDSGQLDLDAPVKDYVPAFTNKGDVTPRHLLAHTSGLSTHVPIVGANRAQRLAHLLREPRQHPTGTRYLYADLNFITLGALVERIGGLRLDHAVRDGITGPLGMRDTLFRPPARRWSHVAATEAGRRGVVHDPAASSLDGVAGHAGLFSTAYDLGLFVHALLDGGPLLQPKTAELLRTNQNAHLGPDAAHGLGVDTPQAWYMSRLTGANTFGHTGFTGTSFVADPDRRLVLVLLTNRVRTGTNWTGMNAARRAVADALA